MDKIPNIGEVCSLDAKRDAIHVAVAPAFAGEELKPGEHVWLSTAYGSSTIAYSHVPAEKQPLVGIVDPFLKSPLKKGQRFWLFMYPGSITSLRHVWTHPAFVAKPLTENI
jgi:hypothetical protein